MPDPILCTLAILTRNSGNSLAGALAHASQFAEIIICDGNSTDNTHALAQAEGARIIMQDQAFLNPDGSIRDFAGVRNQTLGASTQPWFFFLDADEELTYELINELRTAVMGEPKAFWVPRQYLWQGIHIRSSTTYPNQQMRFFSRTAVTSFIKPVHERIELRPGACVESLKTPMLVTLEHDRTALWRKWNRYVELEASRHKTLTWRAWLRVVRFHFFASLRFLLRLPVVYFFSPGPRLPVWRELDEHLYNFHIVRRLFKNIQ